MELDRLRQQEWEEAQKATSKAAASAASSSSGFVKKDGGGGEDVNQYGYYLGGDSQNRVGTGIGFGAARRQIIGPRDPRPAPPGK